MPDNINPNASFGDFNVNDFVSDTAVKKLNLISNTKKNNLSF